MHQDKAVYVTAIYRLREGEACSTAATQEYASSISTLELRRSKAGSK